MLLSHKHKFIFIKTRKTAGTSLECDLSKEMGSKDIVTQIFPAEEGHIPRNFKRIFDRRPRFYNHMSASEVRSLVKPKLFSTYFKFAVEREPIDKCISHFSMLRNSDFHNAENRGLTWDEYVRAANFPVDHAQYTDERGDLLVDRILRYEQLQAELHSVQAQLGIPPTPIKTRAKSGFRQVPVVTERQIGIIYDAFETSLAFTGYNPGRSRARTL